MKKLKTYTLAVGEQGVERLRLLNQIYNPYSQSMFKRLKLREKMNVLTIGCGIGIMDAWIASQLAPLNAEITATDISQEQLTIAKRYADANKITNIHFATLDITELNARAEYDLIYTRFTLSHLPNAIDIMKRVKSALKPNGILWCEDMANSKVYSIPDNIQVNLAVKLITDLGVKRGFDADFGLKLYSSFKALNLKNIEINLEQPVVYSHPEKDLLLHSVREVGQQFVDQDLIAGQELNVLTSKLEDFTKNERNLMSLTPVFQVIGEV